MFKLVTKNLSRKPQILINLPYLTPGVLNHSKICLVFRKKFDCSSKPGLNVENNPTKNNANDSQQKQLRKIVESTMDYKRMIESNEIFINKIPHAVNVIKDSNQSLFLARCRRMGKTQFLKTLHFLYEEGGEESYKKLPPHFQKNLDQSQFDWEKMNVIYLNFSGTSVENWESFRSQIGVNMIEQCSGEVIENEMKKNQKKQKRISRINIFNKIYGIKGSDIYEPLESILDQEISYLQMKKRAENKGSKVVLLIDEYDKPYQQIINAETDTKIIKEYQTNLKIFFETIKKLVEGNKLEKVFVTGILRLSQTSIFSGANQFKDLTFESKYETAFGFTEDEIITNFKDNIEFYAPQAKEENEMQSKFEKELQKIKRHYNGLAFNPYQEPNKLIFTPLSVATHINSQVDKIQQNQKLTDPQPYWNMSGGGKGLMIDMLIKYPKYLNLFKPFLYDENYEIEYDWLKIINSIDLFQLPQQPILLSLFSGYLTISPKSKNKVNTVYLRFPNIDVKNNFMLGIYDELSELNKFVSRLDESLKKQELENIASNLIKSYKQAYEIIKKYKVEGNVSEREINKQCWKLIRNHLQAEWFVQLDSSNENADGNLKKPDIIINPFKDKAYPIYIVEATKIFKLDQKTLISKLESDYFIRDYQNLYYHTKPSQRHIFWIGIHDKDPSQIEVCALQQSFIFKDNKYVKDENAEDKYYTN